MRLGRSRPIQPIRRARRLSTAFHLNKATISHEHVLSAPLTLVQPLSTWTGNDYPERFALEIELASGPLWFEPAEDPLLATDVFMQQVAIVMPAPTLTNGLPQQGWAPTSVTTSDWRKLRLLVDGHDLTYPRGKKFLPQTDVHNEPFGDGDALFAFPGITEFEDPAVFGLTPFAPVRLKGKDAGGVYHDLYAGFIASYEQHQLEDGVCLAVHCVGALYRLDLMVDPPDLLDRAQDMGQIIADAVNHKRNRYMLHLTQMTPVTTGITGTKSGEFKPLLSGAIQDYLAQMQQSTLWTVTNTRPWTPTLKTKDLSTVHATVSYGTPGAVVALSQDFTQGTTAVYGSGTNGHCSWMGARFPNLVGRATPAFPLGVGATFIAGDGQTGFADFAAYLRRGQYGEIQSDDTYLAADVDSVEQFQDRAGITIDGIVGAQTWEAAFTPGLNQGSLAGAYVDSIWELAATRKWLLNAQGAFGATNPLFDPTVPRVEMYVPFGDNVSKRLGRTSGKQIVARDYPAGRVGTITLTTDPPERSRFDLDAGMNIRVTNYAGGSVLLHITRRERNWQTNTVTLTVDEKARDRMTAAAIHQRDRDVSDLTRRKQFGRARSRVFNDYGTWLCEDGAGEIPLMNQQGGFWNVQRIAAARRGTIERVSLAFGTGLTEHLLNLNLGANPPGTIPGATRGHVSIFSGPVTANMLANTVGNPLTALADGSAPIDHNQDQLDQWGLIYSAGGPGQNCGFFPNNDPGDGTSTGLTGRFEDGGSVQFGPTGYLWLWVAIYTPASCVVGGRLFPGPPS